MACSSLRGSLSGAGDALFLIEQDEKLDPLVGKRLADNREELVS
jgi:hypothetical protein